MLRSGTKKGKLSIYQSTHRAPVALQLARTYEVPAFIHITAPLLLVQILELAQKEAALSFSGQIVDPPNYVVDNEQL